jgi:hypothetical protein
MKRKEKGAGREVEKSRSCSYGGGRILVNPA